MENEKVIGYVDNLVSFGIIAPRRKSLIVTDKRLLLVDSNSALPIVVSIGVAYYFGVFGRGITNRLSKDSIKENTEKLSQMNMDELLKSDPKNMDFNYSEIKRIKITRRKIIIETTRKKLKYKLSNTDVRKRKSGVYEAYVQTLQPVLGDKLKARIKKKPNTIQQ